MTPQTLRDGVVGVALIALVTGSYQFGRHVKTGEIAEEKREAERAHAEKVTELQDKADLLATANGLLRAQSAPKDRLITQEITRYVEVTPAAQRCTLPGTWRVRHDAAATGMPIAAKAGSVAPGTDSDVDDATALATVGENYAAARECFARLDGWKRRYLKLELTGSEK